MKLLLILEEQIDEAVIMTEKQEFITATNLYDVKTGMPKGVPVLLYEYSKIISV